MLDKPLAQARLYLATPYSGTAEEQEVRFDMACQLAGILIWKGWSVFSPIAHSKPIAEASGLPHNAAFWSQLNSTWLRWSTDFVVAKIEDWKESKGVRFELTEARKLGKGLWTVSIGHYKHYLNPSMEVHFERLTGNSLC